VSANSLCGQKKCNRVLEVKAGTEVITAATPSGMAALVAASAVAGGLAVPLHVVATPLCAAGAGLFAALGLFVWGWSRLPPPAPTAAQSGMTRLVRAAVWAAIGLAVGLFLLAVMRLVIEPAVPAIASRMVAAGALPVWRRVAIIYVAAVGEELIFRLFLLSAVAGVTARLLRLPRHVPTPVVIWTANGLSALLFAGVHLPAWGGVVSFGVGLALSVMTLNAVSGVVLGYVFVNRGIVAAIWTHAGADCAIQLIGPLTG
jgi:membrane protease YdiL (CAAX protease family)